MLNLMLQLQMLLAALSAFLPLAPAEHRTRAAEILDVAAKALAAGGSVATNLDDLAAKLAAIRAEVEAIAISGEMVSAAQLDAAMDRVRSASAAFRAALEIAEADANKVRPHRGGAGPEIIPLDRRSPACSVDLGASSPFLARYEQVHPRH
jgi:hypothetical protein